MYRKQRMRAPLQTSGACLTHTSVPCGRLLAHAPAMPCHAMPCAACMWCVAFSCTAYVMPCVVQHACLCPPAPSAGAGVRPRAHSAGSGRRHCDCTSSHPQAGRAGAVGRAGAWRACACACRVCTSRPTLGQAACTRRSRVRRMPSSSPSSRHQGMPSHG